jgi:hypothetical protein
MNIIRQGDVSLIKVASLPAGAQPLQSESARVVLAYGEVTGHAHAIYENTEQVRLWAVGKVKYLEVMAAVMLRHEEHTHVELAPGVYKLPVQVEYEPQELRITRD